VARGVHLAALARYPFLPEAGEHVAAEGPSLEELLRERVYAGARAKGRDRLRAAIEEGELPPAAPHAGPRECLEELLSYVYARILACALDDPYVVRRHALAEAVRVRALLAAEPDPALVARAAQVVGLAFEPTPAGFRAHFTEYLRFAVHLKDLDWKLVRQPLKRGFVEMDAQAASRLIQEALRRRIESELPKPLAPEVEKAVAADLPPLAEAARVRKEKFEGATSFGPADLTLMPPCMKHVLGQLQSGENVAHTGRFAIVTFLHKIGLGPEDIMKLFAQAPDFKEEMTRYQVEHITGVSSGTTYSVPGCEALKTFHHCYADDLCRSTTKAGKARVAYPGDYYRYMAEAKAAVAALAQQVPLAGEAHLILAAAQQYGLLRRLQEIAADPDWPRLDGAKLVDLAHALLPGSTRDEAGQPRRLLVDEKDPWQVVRLFQQSWVREALRPVPRVVP
jgi:DNA primase large subunit